MIGIAAAILLVGFAAAFAAAKTTLVYGIVALAALPLFAYVAYRWPIVFPFGVYAITVPIDPLLKAASGTGGTLTKVIGFVTIVALLVHAFRMRRLDAPPVSWLWWGLYLLWGLCGWAWSIVPEETAQAVQIIGSLYALYTVAAVYPITPQTYVWARRGIVLSGIITAAYGLYAYAAGQRLGTSRLSLSSGQLQIDPNHYAAYFSIPIAFLVARFFVVTSAKDRLVAGALAVPMFLNVLLTGSRGGLIASGFVIVYLGVRARAYKLLGTALAAALAMSFAIPNVWQRVLDPNMKDASGRNEIWNVGFVAMKHYGLFGAGLATFPFVYDDNIHNALQKAFTGWHRPAHNVLVQTIVDMGVPGVLLLLTAWWQSVRQNRNIPRTSMYFPDRLATEAATIALFISALSIDLMWFKYLWLDLMMVVLLANAYRPRLLAGRPPVVPRRTAMPAARVREHARL